MEATVRLETNGVLSNETAEGDGAARGNLNEFEIEGVSGETIESGENGGSSMLVWSV